MRAHRVRVEVTEDHEVRVTLPRDFPTGTADVLVVAPSASTTAKPRISVDELMAARLEPPEADIDHAVGLILSRLELSMERLLASRDDL